MLTCLTLDVGMCLSDDCSRTLKSCIPTCLDPNGTWSESACMCEYIC